MSDRTLESIITSSKTMNTNTNTNTETVKSNPTNSTCSSSSLSSSSSLNGLSNDIPERITTLTSPERVINKRVFTPLSGPESSSDDDEQVRRTRRTSVRPSCTSAPSRRPTPTATHSRTLSSSSSSSSTSSSVTRSIKRRQASRRRRERVYAVLLVAFDHLQGPIIEFGYPETYQHDLYLNQNLPFLALPDGAHAREEDYSYFHLLNDSIEPNETIFGISCNRQIQADELIKKGKEVTRSTVQKAIVVLASKPIFGPLRDKLGVITRTFFAQRDFEDKSILVDLFTSFESQHSKKVDDESKLLANRRARVGSGDEDEDDEQERLEDGEDSGMYMGTSLRELVYKFRSKTLMLLKLLMLQRKVMFYAAHSPVEMLCTMQYSLVALVPSLLTHLDDAASPQLDHRSQNISKPSSLRTSDRSSLVRYLGLPLNIFGEGSFFQPYLPLQQIDLLQARSFLVGTTNSIFQQQRDSPIDVLVRLESAQLEILDSRLAQMISLTAADRKWMDEIVSTVDNSYDPNDPATPIGMNFIGSDDFLRAKFEEYVCSLLACIKFTDFLKKGDRAQMLLSGNELASYNVESFNEAFVRSFKKTPAFEIWNRNTDDAIFDLVEPKHPMEGKTNPIEDVGIRLAHGLHDLHLPENLAPTREAISRGVQQGSESIWGAYSFLRSDLSKRQKEFNERRSQTGSPAPGSPPVLDMAGNTLLAGVDVAKTGVSTVANGIGSFLASRKVSGFFSGAGPSTKSSSANPQTSSPLATGPPPPLELKQSTLSPSSLSTSPGVSRSPSPSSATFLKPLSTASLATTPPASTSALPPSTNATTGGFFTSFLSRRSPEPNPSLAIQAQPIKELELGQELMPRDLDKEYAAKALRQERRNTLHKPILSPSIIPIEPEHVGDLSEERLKELEEMTDEELTRAGIPGASEVLRDSDYPQAPKMGGGEFE